MMTISKPDKEKGGEGWMVRIPTWSHKRRLTQTLTAPASCVLSQFTFSDFVMCFSNFSNVFKSSPSFPRKKKSLISLEFEENIFRALQKSQFVFLKKKTLNLFSWNDKYALFKPFRQNTLQTLTIQGSNWLQCNSGLCCLAVGDLCSQ